MKKITKNLLPLIVLFSMLTIISCGEDNEPILINTGDGFDAKLNNSYSDSLSATVFTDEITDGQINVRLALESDETMRRVYVTKNVFGQGFETADAAVEFNVNAKADGSIDLPTGSQNGTIFTFNFDLTSFPDADGTIVYKFWATKNKGDHRDETKDLIESAVTLTINLGGSNPAAAVISQTGVKLFAPLADGTSSTFLSTANGSSYTFNDGELAALWDFGYFYSVLGAEEVEKKASFASVSSYELAFDNGAVVDMDALAVDENGEIDLNAFYFSSTVVEATTFTNASMSSDLNFIATSTVQEINNLEVGDIIGFVDQYGKKGVIKITDLQPANGQFYNQGAFIQFDIKIQP